MQWAGWPDGRMAVFYIQRGYQGRWSLEPRVLRSKGTRLGRGGLCPAATSTAPVLLTPYAALLPNHVMKRNSGVSTR